MAEKYFFKCSTSLALRKMQMQIILCDFISPQPEWLRLKKNSWQMLTRMWGKGMESDATTREISMEIP